MAPETPAAACRETPAKLPKATVWVLLLVFAIYLPGEEESTLPEVVVLHGVRPANGATVRLLGHDAPIPWRPMGAGALVTIPAAARVPPPCEHAWALEISAVE